MWFIINVNYTISILIAALILAVATLVFQRNPLQLANSAITFMVEE